MGGGLCGGHLHEKLDQGTPTFVSAHQKYSGIRFDHEQSPECMDTSKTHQAIGFHKEQGRNMGSAHDHEHRHSPADPAGSARGWTQIYFDLLLLKGKSE